MRIPAAILSLFLLTAASTVDQGAGERLAYLPIPGTLPWKEVINRRHGGGEWEHQYLHQGERWSNYSESVAVNVFANAKSLTPGEALRATFAYAEGSRCEGMRIVGPREEVENGVTVAYAEMYCAHVRGRRFGILIVYKILRGTQALYTVNWEVPVADRPAKAGTESGDGPPAETPEQRAMLTAGEKYLVEQVYLCGGTSTDPRCQTAANP
jgi:hypothetical protein